MTTTHDLGFLNQLESITLPPGTFDHEGHVRAAWTCFRQDESEAAEARFIKAIKRFAASVGQAGKYHETITRVLMSVIKMRMELGPDDETWGQFARRNPDLLNDGMGLLQRHYSPELLFSEEARLHYLKPDREALDPA